MRSIRLHVYSIPTHDEAFVLLPSSFLISLLLWFSREGKKTQTKETLEGNLKEKNFIRKIERKLSESEIFKLFPRH